MRSPGTMLRTSVQADRQGPSITTRSPVSRTLSNRSRNGPTCPPGLARMRISARAGACMIEQAASVRPAMSHVRGVRMVLSVLPRAAQRFEADAGGIETAIDRQDLPRDVARTFAAQEEDRLRELLFQAVAVERDRVVIVGADVRRMHRLGHRGVDRTRRDAV